LGLDVFGTLVETEVLIGSFGLGLDAFGTLAEVEVLIGSLVWVWMLLEVLWGWEDFEKEKDLSSEKTEPRSNSFSTG
jgi:hypothetical protein